MRSACCRRLDVPRSGVIWRVHELEAFHARSLTDTTCAYVFLDATYIKGRLYNRVVSRALVVEDVSGVNELDHDDVTNAHDLRAKIHKGRHPAWLAGG